jgi:nucleoid-associated protein YgaU
MFGKLIGALLVVAVIWAVAARSSSGAGRPVVYTVKPYDTLWSIAAAHYGGDTREAIWKLRQRNGLETATLRPGEKLVLP